MSFDHDQWRRDSAKAYEDSQRAKHRYPVRRIGRNQERSREAYERDFGDKAEWVRQRRCDACGAAPPNDPHHHPTRAAGGTSKDLSTLCRSCHDFYHDQGPETFAEVTGLDLVEVNARVEAEWAAR